MFEPFRGWVKSSNKNVPFLKQICQERLQKFSKNSLNEEEKIIFGVLYNEPINFVKIAQRVSLQ